MLSLSKFSVLATAAAAVLLLSSPLTNAANCTSDDLEAVSKFDAVLGDAPECAHLNSLVASEVTQLQVCADTECVKLIKKVASQAPDCTVDGTTPISLIAFMDCTSVSASSSSGSSSSAVTTPSPSPAEVAGEASTSSSSTTGASSSVTTTAPATPAPTTSAASTSSVLVASVVTVLSVAAWM
jgi:hypothetical protein|uniref:Elicitin-like protein n=1 Tax=Globisporangium ultimum (strain ATCC 200006 / CBS 805.95 / DAOM BR144) TaxID=431595 RepID=K3WZD8_GLOUD